MLDEFQEIVEIDRNLPKLMRSVFQEQPEVAHVYLGSKRHMMERIFNDENEPFWRSARQMELGPIAPAPFAEYIARRFAETGRTVGRSGDRPPPGDHVGPSLRDAGALLLPLGRDAGRR